MSTPKQAAARLLLNTLDSGAKPPAQLSREEMAAALGERVSDQKREKIIEFGNKILTPFKDRLSKITAAAAAKPEGQAEEG
jgi:hypothetical protein